MTERDVKPTAEDWERAAEIRAQFCYEQAKSELSDADVNHWQVQHMAIHDVMITARRIAAARSQNKVTNDGDGPQDTTGGREK